MMLAKPTDVIPTRKPATSPITAMPEARIFSARIADQHLRRVGLQQIVEPSRPGPFFPGHMQLAPQTVDKLQNATGFGFHDRALTRDFGH